MRDGDGRGIQTTAPTDSPETHEAPLQRLLVHPAEMRVVEDLEAAVLVIGGGVAGLSAAIEAAEHRKVTLITKGWLSDTNTEWAQGGVASVLGADDSVDLHNEDTLSVGQGLCHERVVRKVIEEGPAAVQQLIDWGAQFDRDPTGALQLGLEGGHSRGRVVHAHGDATGREFQRILVERARMSPRIRILEHVFALDCLRGADGRVAGVLAFCSGRFLRIRAESTICATGGCGQLFRETTNRDIATADGHAMLFRAGAWMRGMEFMQFHPTTLYIAGSSRVLISEAARGEGAILRDVHGVAFLKDLHPMGDLAPRDIVSRAVLGRIVETGHTNVFLDLTHLQAGFVRERFPRIYQVCMTFGLDITRDPIPVTPAAHYMIGGAAVDEVGRTSLDGLYAVGEVACSGLHGANRLASNSLLEGLVLGKAAGNDAGHRAEVSGQRVAGETAEPPGAPAPDRDFNPADLRNSLTSMMWRVVGLIRDGEHLREAIGRLRLWQETADRLRRPAQRDWELRNLILAARLMAEAALERKESRGVHYRRDHASRDDEHWRVDLDLRSAKAGEVTKRRQPLPVPSMDRRSVDG